MKYLVLGSRPSTLTFRVGNIRLKSEIENIENICTHLDIDIFNIVAALLIVHFVHILLDSKLDKSIESNKGFF